MLNEELIDVVNQGNAWALVGSGPSCMAGACSWNDFALATLAACSTPHPKHFNESQFMTFVGKGDFPKAFDYLQRSIGREPIDATVQAKFAGLTTPGAFHKCIARWPFAGYITSNYDSLLELSLQAGGFGAWSSVGNTPAENQLIEQDVHNIVWHPHGIAGAPASKSRLIVSSSDYDEVYAVSSLTVHALDALLRLKRLVVFGFGFSDIDLLRVLERIKRVTTPAKPAFAFLPSGANQSHFREAYNVEVIPYHVHNATHSDVLHQLDIYQSFIPTRDVTYSVPVTTYPEFNEQVTSIITQNRLIQHNVPIPDDARAGLLTACVLHAMANSGPIPENAIRKLLAYCGSDALSGLPRVIATLCKDKLLKPNADRFEITDQGKAFLDGAAAHSSLLFDQFRTQIKQRVESHSQGIADVNINNVSTVCSTYFQTIGQKCGLGIAQQLCHVDRPQSDARSVALLHELHRHFRFCNNRAEADVLVKTTRDVLGSATQAEEEYLGLLSQSYFGRHLLNADPNSLALRQEEIANTLFLLDASFVIQLLAVSASRHQFAESLYKRLRHLNCQMVTTHDLLAEVAEHARWAYALLKRYGPHAREVVEAASGHRRTPNLFLESYLLNPSFGPNSNYQAYFNATVNANGTRPDPVNLEPLLKGMGIETVALETMAGFVAPHAVERDALIAEIAERRRQRNTFRRERQVVAEANVVVLIKNLMNGAYSIGPSGARSVFFVTHSRVLDDLPGVPTCICISPVSLFNWLLTVRVVGPEDAAALFDEILLTMSLAGVEVIPRRQLMRVFSGVTEASRSRVEELKTEHRQLVRERYALDPDEAFKDVNPLAWPTIEYRFEQDMIAALREQVKRRDGETADLRQKLSKNEKESREFARLKAEEAVRKQRNKKKARREKSRPKKKKKKKR